MHKQEDLFKMHTYRDGILSSRGAYVIYPGDDDEVRYEGKRQNLFVRHPSAFGGAPKNCVPSVGAFSLAPRKVVHQRPVISDFLRLAFDAFFSADQYVEEGSMNRAGSAGGRIP